jgi:Ca2+-binding RTX toxin-like protein
MGTVTDIRRNHEFNADGTLKRKYEGDEAPEGKAAKRSLIGLALGGAVILLKTILTGTASEALADSPRPAKEKDGEVELTSTTDQEAVEPPSPTGNDDAELQPLRKRGGAGGDQPFAPSFAVAPDDIPKLSGGMMSAAAGNDNEGLYGAVPGRPISLTSDRIPQAIGATAGVPGHASSQVDDGDRGTNQPDNNGQGPDADDDDAGGGTDALPPRPVNRLPSLTAPVILAGLLADSTLVVSARDLLQHASDPDGDTLVVRDLRASSGSLVQTVDGTWLFTPEAADTGSVTLSYSVFDKAGKVAQTAQIDLVSRDAATHGTPAGDTLIGDGEANLIDAGDGADTVEGGAGNDTLYGGDGDDRILAGGGDDVVHAGAGNDVVMAGAGNDVVLAGRDNDVIHGEAGDDKLFGEGGDDQISAGAGDDLLVGGAGDDRLAGGDGNDALLGDDGKDVLAGGAGDDSLQGGAGDDQFSGGAGHDALSGGAGRDAITADAGDDIIVGGAGNDIADGGSGNDLFVAEVNDGNDQYDGGAGVDTYSIATTTADAIIDLLEESATSLEIGDDLIENFERVHAGRGDDTIIASNATNVIIGGGGDDVFVFRSTAAIGHGAGHRDRILDFDVGDRIDLDDVREEFAEDLNSSLEDQNIRRFVLIRDQDEFSQPGEMKLRYEKLDGRDVTILAGNTDWDGQSEFELELSGTYQLSDNDFHRTV